jgi:hypothetical protein
MFFRQACHPLLLFHAGSLPTGDIRHGGRRIYPSRRLWHFWLFGSPAYLLRLGTAAMVPQCWCRLREATRSNPARRSRDSRPVERAVGLCVGDSMITTAVPRILSRWTSVAQWVMTTVASQANKCSWCSSLRGRGRVSGHKRATARVQLLLRSLPRAPAVF